MSYWRRFFLCFIFSFALLHGHAQFSLKIKLNSKPGEHANDPVYISGNFNNWNPGDYNYMLVKKENVETIILTGLSMAMYEFKFTRGSWQKVEANTNGDDIENRVVKLVSDTTIEIDIKAWKDDHEEIAKQHTASPQVKLLDSAFLIPQLQRKRNISIYLPYDYELTEDRYPVIYMNDGQCLFDEITSGYGEWGVDECVDSMIKKGKQAAIIIGINSGQERLTEYSPYPFNNLKDMEGDAYVDFVVKTLKPYVDKNYRTLVSKENTTIAGSSLGGLISYYAMLKYPEVFGNAGVFSPSFWINTPALSSFTDSVGNKLNGKVFFYMGAAEGERYVNDMKTVADALGAHSKTIIYRIVDTEGKHNAKAWRKWFAEFYVWILSDGLNSPVSKKITK